MTGQLMLLGYIKIYESITFLFDYKWLMIVNWLSIVQVFFVLVVFCNKFPEAEWLPVK